MFTRLRQLWRKLAEPAPKDLATAEPAGVRAGWRRNRKYSSRRECDRAYRERQKLKAGAKEIAPAEVDPILAAPRVDLQSGERAATVRQSLFSLSAIGGLMKPGIAASLPLQLAPPVVEAKSIPIESPMLAQTVNEPAVVPAPMPESEWRPNWAEESRVDLPIRDPEHIARLLRFETAEMTAARIANDRQRYLHSRRGMAAPDVQSAIVSGRSDKDNRVAHWVKRG